MTTQDLINTLRQGKPMTDKLMREVVRELEEVHMMKTALRAKDADYAALKAAAGPVAKSYVEAKNNQMWSGANVTGETMALPGVTVAQLDELARLCGEG